MKKMIFSKKLSKKGVIMKRVSYVSFFAVIVTIAMVTIFSCSLEPRTESVPKQEVMENFDDLKEGAYRGGSLIYNPDDPLVNHLIPGMVLPIRFASLDLITVGENNEKALGEVSSSVKYGALTIKSISKEAITITYTLCDKSGKKIKQDSIILNAEDTCDIDGDNDNDITYTRPIDNRPGFENAMYLSFICSDAEKSTTMYKLSPEYYNDNKYPSGIIGVNPSGNFLILNSDFDTVSRSDNGSSRYNCRVKNGCFLPGDFILGGADGRIEKAIIVDRNPDSSAITTASDEISIQDAIQVMNFKLKGNLDSILDKYGNDANRTYLSIFSNNYTYYFFNNSAGYCKFNNVFNFGVDVDANITVHTTSVSGYAKTVLVVSDTATLDAKLNYSYSYSGKKKMCEPSKYFLVYGIPFEIILPVYFGLDINANAKASFYTSASISSSVGAGVNFSAGLIPPYISVSPYGIFSLSTGVVPPSYSVYGKITATPYLEVNPAIEIAHVITPECVNKISLTGVAEYTYVNQYYYYYVKVLKASVTLGIQSDAYLDVLGILRPHLGKLINYSKVLYSYSREL